MSTSTSSGFIPDRDGDFNGVANTFLAKVKPDAAAYGLTPEELALLEAEVAEWDAKYTQMMERHEEARGATAGKDDARSTLTKTMRMLARKIQSDPAVTDQMKAAAGLPIHSTTRNPAPIPTTAPLADISDCAVEQHTIRFSDSLNHNTRFGLAIV